MADEQTSTNTDTSQGAGADDETQTDITSQDTGLTAGVKPEGEGEQEGDEKPSGSDEGKQDETGQSADYEVKLPEGVDVPAEQMAEFKGMVSEFKGLSEQQIAQKLVDYQAKLGEQSNDQVVEFYAKQDKDWNEAASKDPVIVEHEKDAVKLIGEEGDAELIEALNTSRMGNNPALRRFVAKTAVRINKLEAFIRDRIGEDPYAGDGAGSSGPAEPKGDGEILYPNMSKTG